MQIASYAKYLEKASDSPPLFLSFPPYQPMNLRNIIIAVAAIVGFCHEASAVAIGLDRLIGTVEPGTPADPANETQMINFLVNAYNSGTYANGVIHPLGDNPLDPSPELYFLNVSAPTLVPAFGSLSLTPTTDPIDHTTGGASDVYTLNTGGFEYEYLTAKYGHRTALFYVGGLIGEIQVPMLSKNNPYFQGAGSGNGYGLSGTDFYNQRLQVPDGGASVMLLGLAVIGLAWGKKKYH